MPPLLKDGEQFEDMVVPHRTYRDVEDQRLVDAQRGEEERAAKPFRRRPQLNIGRFKPHLCSTGTRAYPVKFLIATFCNLPDMQERTSLLDTFGRQVYLTMESCGRCGVMGTKFSRCPYKQEYQEGACLTG